MHRLSYFIGILFSVAIFNPYPTWEHFIWPVDSCVLADICNHTWIPECGFDNTSEHKKKLFIDDCDMWEFNCDNNRNYEVINYSSCFEYSPCPTITIGYNRRGNYKYVLEGRKLIYAPILPHTHIDTTFYFPGTTRPNLPAIMFHGKRRYTPQAKKNKMRTTMTTPVKKKKMVLRTHSVTVLKQSTQRRTMVLKKMTVIKNGRVMQKVVKGFLPESSQDSDFLQ